MNKNELAKKLNDMILQYPARIPWDILADAAKNQLVIVYGESDDIMRLTGSIDDDVGCYDGGTAHIINGALAFSKCSDGEDCPYFKKKKLEAKKIDAVWDQDEIQWQYKTSIPHAEFSIWEDGEEYCRGIVFSLDELEAAADSEDKQDQPNTTAPIFIPYCSHTAKEMIPIFMEIYRSTEGEQLDFVIACKGSADPRLNTMNSFARDVCFEMTKAVFLAKYSTV